MHCPKCGLQIESDTVSFCSRCGQTLDLVRSAMLADAAQETGLEVRRNGVNLGVILMFLASVPAVLSVLFSPIAIPAAFLLLIIGYVIVILGSGPLMKAIRTDDSTVSEIMHRALRKDLALGSTLMLVGIVMATCLVAFLPIQWQAKALIAFPLATFLGLLLTSGWISRSIGEIIGGDTPRVLKVGTGAAAGDLPEASFIEDIPPVRLPTSVGATTNDLPPSVTEGTTQLLKEER